MSSSKIPAPCSLLPPVRPTLGTHSPAYHIAESRHVTDMAAVFHRVPMHRKLGQRAALAKRVGIEGKVQAHTSLARIIHEVAGESGGSGTNP